MNWLDKLEQRFGHIAVPGLIRIIVVVNVLAFVMLRIDPSWIGALTLDPNRVMHGEVWRLITYLFIPPEMDPIFLFFALYFLWIMNDGLEQEWGAFRLNVFYVCGMIATTVVAFFITHHSVTNAFLNLSIFLAFATVLPDFEVLLFFILPVKVKWLGWLAAAFVGVEIVLSPYPANLAPIVSLTNYLLFFGPQFFQSAATQREDMLRRARFEAASHVGPLETRHRCAICGKTEVDNPEMEFRVAEDDLEYCMEHLAQAPAGKKD
ncbi:MAG: rhomboid family intramembrane serine protease [Verrucomicrobia bacterium]|nr:rhomboid family intramembrane serine protease [Verrucomicrobiota bacterium]